MYGSHAVSTDHWRHFKPFAPDIEVDVIVSGEVFIDLKPYWLQGARDFVDYVNIDPEAEPPVSHSPDPNVLPVRVPNQRGWLLDPILSVPGRKGIVLQSTYKDGFIYRPNIDNPSGSDCFNYQFSNGTQLSNYGKITINIKLPFDFVWNIVTEDPNVYYPNVDTKRLRMSLATTPAHPDYRNGYLRRFKWHLVGPVLYYKDGVPYIGIRDQVIHQTRYYYGGMGLSVSYLDNGRTLDYRTYRTDSNLVGIDETTNAPYIPTHKFPTMYIEFLNYPKKRTDAYGYNYINFGYVERFIYKVEDFFGKNWHRSGKIKVE